MLLDFPRIRVFRVQRVSNLLSQKFGRSNRSSPLLVVGDNQQLGYILEQSLPRLRLNIRQAKLENDERLSVFEHLAGGFLRASQAVSAA